MGAEVFTVDSTGDNVLEAFRGAVEDAEYESGHGGYSGTIAEKEDFVLIDLPEGQDPHKFADELIHANDPRIDNKWGPAGAIKTGDGEWLFFGWASS